MEPTEIMLIIAVVAAPIALVAIAAILKGYHLWLHVYKGDRKHKKGHDC